jgi:hypothetical protein
MKKQLLYFLSCAVVSGSSLLGMQADDKKPKRTATLAIVQKVSDKRTPPPTDSEGNSPSFYLDSPCGTSGSGCAYPLSRSQEVRRWKEPSKPYPFYCER